MLTDYCYNLRLKYGSYQTSQMNEKRKGYCCWLDSMRSCYNLNVEFMSGSYGGEAAKEPLSRLGAASDAASCDLVRKRTDASTARPKVRKFFSPRRFAGFLLEGWLTGGLTGWLTGVLAA